MLPTDLTVLAVVERNGKFLIVEERVAGRRVLTQPGGHIEAGESPEDAVVREVLEARCGTEIFVGDNGNRLRFSPTPPLFRLAARRGIRDLPGSDPLPFPGEATRVGRYGFAVRGEISRTTPAQDLKIMLESPLSLDRFGHLESLGRFFRSQSAMQRRKRAPGFRRA